MSKSLHKRLDKLEPPDEPQKKGLDHFRVANIYKNGIVLILLIESRCFFFEDRSLYKKFISDFFPDEEYTITEYRMWPREKKVPLEERKYKVTGWDDEGNICFD